MCYINKLGFDFKAVIETTCNRSLKAKKNSVTVQPLIFFPSCKEVVIPFPLYCDRASTVVPISLSNTQEESVFI